MESSAFTHVLIVANRTAATPMLLEEVRRRARRGPCAFTLLVPQLPSAGEEEAQQTLALALPLLQDATGGEVRGIVGPSDPVLAVERVLARRPVDEIIVSTLPAPVSHWLRRDLPARLRRLDLPVTVVTARASATARNIPEFYAGSAGRSG